MNNNSFSADQIGYFNKPTYTREDIIKSNITNNRIRALGIKVPDSFDSALSENSNNDYTKDELEALRCIYSNKAIPVELEQKLLDKLLYNETKDTNESGYTYKELPTFNDNTHKYIIIIIILTLLNVIQYIKNK